MCPQSVKKYAKILHSPLSFPSLHKVRDGDSVLLGCRVYLRHDKTVSFGYKNITFPPPKNITKNCPLFEKTKQAKIRRTLGVIFFLTWIILVFLKKERKRKKVSCDSPIFFSLLSPRSFTVSGHVQSRAVNNYGNCRCFLFPSPVQNIERRPFSHFPSLPPEEKNVMKYSGGRRKRAFILPPNGLNSSAYPV